MGAVNYVQLNSAWEPEMPHASNAASKIARDYVAPENAAVLYFLNRAGKTRWQGVWVYLDGQEVCRVFAREFCYAEIVSGAHVVKTASFEQNFKVTLGETDVHPVGIRVATKGFSVSDGRAVYFEQVDSAGEYQNYRDFVVSDMPPDVGKQELDRLDLTRWNKFNFEGYQGKKWKDVWPEPCKEGVPEGKVGSMLLPCIYPRN